jgi:kumamolisin
MANISLKGSERAWMRGARVLAPADATERLEVSIIVRRRALQAMRARLTALAAGDRPRNHLSRDEFAQQHGADTADLAAVRAFATAHGLSVVSEHAARRTVILSGSVAQFCAAFSVELHQVAHAGGSFRGRTGAVQLPPELGDVVEAVLGLDNRPQAKPHFRIRPAVGNVNWLAADSGPASFAPTQLASLYDFPSGTGAGECVALIELGGGFRPADLDTYFSGLGVGSPSVTAVSVDHGKNTPTGDANGPDGEVMLDIEVVGAIAPQAKIVVYFAPNTDAGFLDAITTAIHDTTNKPSIISISWGGPESSWTSQAMTAMDDAFQAAATMGITVCVASGDNGSSDGVTDTADHVDFPASSSFALACGGTSLRATQTAIDSETVWNDGASGGASGGGISNFFTVPTWQAGISARKGQGEAVALTMRGVPDVAGDADPQTGYEVRIDGTNTVIGGTSAVAPLWAALIARINQINGTAAGFVNPLLYKNRGALRDVTQGNNGDFDAAAGWDACTGLGSPNGKPLTGAL